MVAPLDIHAVVPHEQVEDPVGTRPPVEHVPHDVQPVHGQTLDQGAECPDHLVRAVGFDDGGHDVLHIGGLVLFLETRVQKLIKYIGIAFGKGGTHPGAGVFGRD